MINHEKISGPVLRGLIRNKSINLAGNKRLKIYGKFDCRSGKRMKKGNRVFFTSEAEATAEGYRPCACCLKDQYQQWKKYRDKFFSVPSTTKQ